MLNCLALLLVFIGSALASARGPSDARVMVWLCLDFCQETEGMVALDLAQVATHRDILTAVSFEKYTLGPNSTLVDNHLPEVAWKIQALGLETWPLLSSFPHPPEFIDWMRQVFANPQPFFDACIAAANDLGYVGYNLDWEPTENVLAEDAQAYAIFVDSFAAALHAEGLLLSVDVATWSPIWNYTALAATRVDWAVSMGTYTPTDSSFPKQLDALVSAFGPARSGVGLMTTNASTDAALPLEEVQWRLDLVKASGVRQLDLWRLPVPPDWWPMLKDF